MKFNKPENIINGNKTNQGIIEREFNTANYFNKEGFRKLIENSIPSGIAVIDDTGRQVYVNQSFCKMVGWNEDELVGKLPPYVYWPQKDTETLYSSLHKTLNNNLPKESFDLVYSHRSGRLITVNVLMSSFMTEDNKVYFMANVFDVTKRKKTEDAYHKSQLFLMSSLESQKGTIIFATDQDYNYLYFNKAHWDSMKYSYNSEIRTGMNILDYISSDEDRKKVRENLDHALKGESFSLIESFGDVNHAYYESFFNPILTEKNEIIGCTVLARDITLRKKAEQDLKDSETKFREIINQINDVIIVFDKKGKIIIWNRGAENVCGLKAEDVLNKSVVDMQVMLTPPPYNDSVEIEKKIKGIITMEAPELLNKIIDSEIINPITEKLRNIQSMVFPIKLNGDHLFCTVIRDTTEIKRYEKELHLISTEKDKFYSVIAQYLYTPFNVFKNFSTIMAEELDNLPIKEIQKMAGMMSKSANNLYTLLDNLLQWTRMNQGKISFEPQKLDFKRISNDAISILRPHADEKRVRINHLTDEEIFVFADIYMLKTILRNLVSFSIKVTNNEGQIDISARETQSDVIISVMYNGIEINPDYLKKLLDISQINSALGQVEEKGTSLGLLLCKEFVEKHGGRIWADNKNGKGTEFSFTLPAYKSSLHENKIKHLRS